MKTLPYALSLLLVVGLGLVPGSDAIAKPSPSKPPAGAATPKVQTHSGVLQSIRVKADGTIAEMFVKIAGSNRTERIEGCGARGADLPLLTWAFTEGRLAHFTVSEGCFANVEIAR